jgi:hypothetical protein
VTGRLGVTIVPAEALWLMEENPEATVKLVQDILL